MNVKLMPKLLRSMILTRFANPLPRQARDSDEAFYVASQRQLIWRAFRKHRLAHVALIILIALYVSCIFADFFAPYDALKRYKDFNGAPPTRIHFISENRGLSRPFVYGTAKRFNRTTFKYEYIIRSMIIETLRKQIEESGLTRYRISQDSGVDQATLCRLMQGKTITVETADILLKYFGLTITNDKKKAR